MYATKKKIFFAVYRLGYCTVQTGKGMFTRNCIVLYCIVLYRNFFIDLITMNMMLCDVNILICLLLPFYRFASYEKENIISQIKRTT